MRSTPTRGGGIEPKIVFRAFGAVAAVAMFGKDRRDFACVIDLDAGCALGDRGRNGQNKERCN
jgi:hypothetical protein